MDTNVYSEQPMICPTCGELVIADPEFSKIVLPVHPDLLFPFQECEASRVRVTLSYVR